MPRGRAFARDESYFTGGGGTGATCSFASGRRRSMFLARESFEECLEAFADFFMLIAPR